MGGFFLDRHTRRLRTAPGDGPATDRRGRSSVALLRKENFARHRTRDRSLLLVILASAILIPELLHLVSDEIGSRTKRPRGRNGAIAGLAFALIYFGLRASCTQQQ